MNLSILKIDNLNCRIGYKINYHYKPSMKILLLLYTARGTGININTPGTGIRGSLQQYQSYSSPSIKTKNPSDKEPASPMIKWAIVKNTPVRRYSENLLLVRGEPRLVKPESYNEQRVWIRAF